MESFEKLKSLVESATADVEKLDNGTKAAAGRIRKVMQEVKKVAQQIRIESQARKVELSKKA